MRKLRLLVCLLLFLAFQIALPLRLSAAPAYVQSADGIVWFAPTNTISAAFTAQNVATGNTIGVFVFWSSTSNTLAGVTDNCGNSYTILTGSLVLDTADGYTGEFAFATNVAGGSKCQITATTSASQNVLSVIIEEITGVLSPSPIDGNGTPPNGDQAVYQPSGSGTDGITSGNFTTVANGDFISAAMINPNGQGPTITAGTNYSLALSDSNHTIVPSLEYQLQSVASSSTVSTFTPSADTWGDIVIAVAFKPGTTSGPPWSGVLDPSRAIDWTTAGVVGGIPSRTNVCSSLTSSATTAQINTAIANCASGEVVSLAAGTYNIAGGILFNNKSGVTLRGAGPDQTFIKFNSAYTCWGQGGNVCFLSGDSGAGGDSSYSNGATWTQNYSIGTSSITLGTITKGSMNLVQGMMIFLDQLDDSSDQYPQMSYGQASGTFSTEGGSNNGRPSRGQQQPEIVQSVSGNGPWTVVVSPALRLPNIRSGQSPGAWWDNGQPVSNDGVENLSIDNTGAGGASQPVIFAFNGYNLWFKNLRVIQGSNGDRIFWGYQTTHVTFRDSYYYGGPGGANGYGPDLYNGADMLVENNITQHIGIPMNNEGCVGCVFGYNYSIDDYYTAGGSAWQYNSSSRHGVGDMFILFEGNEGYGLISDDVHGTNAFVTSFRNYWNGRDGTKTQQTNPVQTNSFSRFHNMVGNILGLSSYHRNYQVSPSGPTDSASTSTADLSIYNIGYSGSEGQHDSALVNDTNVAATLMRWGNYDTVSCDTSINPTCSSTGTLGAVRWCGNSSDPGWSTTCSGTSEVPTGLTNYSNAVPSSTTLPSSFYLAGEPRAWWKTPWGTPAWPPVGPDVNGGNVSGVGGHANNIPAKLCYANTSTDSNYTGGVLRFNASTCYQSDP